MTAGNAQSGNPSFSLSILRAHDFAVISGANLGDGLTEAAGLVLEDTYTLRKNSSQTRIALCPDKSGEVYSISRESVVGTPGTRVHLDSCLTFMSSDGSVTEAIVLVDVVKGLISGTYILPLSSLSSGQEHTLVNIDTDTALERFINVSCISFSSGTHVMLADGSQTLIETLRPGDHVMTRDQGPQPIRWIGRQTLRAEGAYAPIVIRKGTLNNSGDLTLGPNHRLYIYQCNDQAGVGQAEVTVQARLLLNGDSIIQSSGGFIEYFQLLFEDHQIIYVEGIAAESMLADVRTRPILPDWVRNSVARKPHSRSNSNATDLGKADFPDADLARVLPRASTF